MSTTEDQPPIGSPEYHRTRPPSVYANGDVEFRRTHVWTDHQGIIQGNIALGAVEITFHNPQQVRDLIGHLALLAGEMESEVKRQRPADLGWRDEATGLISGPLPEPEGYPCTRCGATDVPKIDGRCSNHSRCNVRAAERVREQSNAEFARAVRAELWKCEDCGWTWPLKDVPSQDAECDACGGTMVKAEAAQVQA